MIARAAASEVLTKGGKDVSMPWENPRTGARGTITPLASAYSQDGMICRDFLASYVKNGNESGCTGQPAAPNGANGWFATCAPGRIPDASRRVAAALTRGTSSWSARNCVSKDLVLRSEA